MSTMNIAIVGGVVLLILALVKMRRSKTGDATPPGRGRARGKRRRRRGRDAPPAPPEPMPLAAAAGQTAATAATEPMSPPATEWPPPDEPAPEQWPPADETSPVEWPPVDEPQASWDGTPEPGSGPRHQDEEPAPAAPAASSGWADDELVTEPGWPMPGEVDVAWSPPPLEQSIGTAPPQGVATAAPDPVTSWNDEAAATAAPADLEWLSAEPAEQDEPAWAPMASEPEPEPQPEPEPEPVWAPAQEVSEAAEESFAWGGPPEAEQPWQPAEEVPAPSGEWEIDPVDRYDAQPTGEIPVVRIPEDEQPQPEEQVVLDPPSFAPPVAAAIAPEPEPVAPFAPAEAWWDDQPAGVAVADAGSPPADDGASTGRFALGGFAMQPGQQALGGVTFRVDLAEAPSAWVIAKASDDAPAGTLALVLDGAINCASEGLEVVMESGFAPTTQGFTVRVAALAAGPFAASGTFRVH